MPISGLLRIAIVTFGLFVSAPPVTLAAPPGDAAAKPSVATQTPTDAPYLPDEAQNCRYQLLPGSHIKVHVCTSREGVEYRMDRRARTAAVVQPFGTGNAEIAAPLPQVQ